MSLPRDTSLRELQMISGRVDSELADIRKEINSINIPAKWAGWTKQDLGDSGWNDLLVSPANVKLPASSAPTWGAWLTDLYALSFSEGDYAFFEGMQFPHSYVTGTDIHPHVHFSPSTAMTDGETVIWEIKYSITPVWGLFPAAVAVNATFTNDATQRAKMPAESLSGTSIIADTHLIADGATIPGDGMTLSGVVMGRVEYLASGTYNSDVVLLSADAHIRLNRLGSRQEYTG